MLFHRLRDSYNCHRHIKKRPVSLVVELLHCCGIHRNSVQLYLLE